MAFKKQDKVRVQDMVDLSGARARMEEEPLERELERLRLENASLRTQALNRGGNISMAAQANGVISMYGLGRFPTSLYLEQWLRVLEAASQIGQYLAMVRPHLPERGGTKQYPDADEKGRGFKRTIGKAKT